MGTLVLVLGRMLTLSFDDSWRVFHSSNGYTVVYSKPNILMIRSTRKSWIWLCCTPEQGNVGVASPIIYARSTTQNTTFATQEQKGLHLIVPVDQSLYQLYKQYCSLLNDDGTRSGKRTFARRDCHGAENYRPWKPSQRRQGRWQAQGGMGSNSQRNAGTKGESISQSV